MLTKALKVVLRSLNDILVKNITPEKKEIMIINVLNFMIHRLGQNST
jgi:hypothetical protein